VLDVLKPHSPSIHDLAVKLGALKGIDQVNITLAEMDKDTETVKVAIEGLDIDLPNVRKNVEALGAVIHSLDEVAVVKRTPSAGPVSARTTEKGS
jgi:hypothetical protein